MIDRQLDRAHYPGLLELYSHFRIRYLSMPCATDLAQLKFGDYDEQSR